MRSRSSPRRSMGSRKEHDDAGDERPPTEIFRGRARPTPGGQVDRHGLGRGEAQGLRDEAEQAESRPETHQQAGRRLHGLQAPEAEEVRAPEHGRRQLLPGGEAAGHWRAVLMAQRKPNPHRFLPGGLLEIQLTQGQVTIIDARDAWVLNYSWSAKQSSKGRWYAVAWAGRRIVRLHRLLLDTHDEIDHLNGDSLDNRRLNIRTATRQQNCQASQRLRNGKTSRFRGVCWDTGHHRWLAQFKRPDGRKITKRFRDEEEAARWWDSQARLHYRDFAAPNFSLQ